MSATVFGWSTLITTQVSAGTEKPVGPWVNPSSLSQTPPIGGSALAGPETEPAADAVVSPATCFALPAELVEEVGDESTSGEGDGADPQPSRAMIKVRASHTAARERTPPR